MNFVQHSRLASGIKVGIKACLIAIAVGLLLSGPPAALAQSVFANLSGTVTDSGGAVIRGAKIHVIADGTKVDRQTVTNSSGFFSMTELPTGTYTVSAESKGFQKWQGTGIVLQSNDDKTLSIPLKIGAETMTVEVSADSSDMEITDSGAKSIHISAKELEKMTLVGRNATEMLKVLPGFAMNSAGGTNSPAYSGGVIGINGSIGDGVGGLGAGMINGVGGAGVSLNSDGQATGDPGSYSGTPVNPNPDMISEMTVQTSNFGADNAKGPVVINTVSKAGTESFHGDARFHVRNSAMNAEDANLKSNEANPQNGLAKGQLKANEHYYYPGGGIGGPIIIPGTNFNKSRTKFQFHESYEYYGQQVGSTQPDRSFVPSTAMLKGDFSALSDWATLLAKETNNNSWFGKTSISSMPQFATWNTGFKKRADAGCTFSAAGVLSDACLDKTLAMPLLQAMAPKPTTPGGVPNSFGFNYINNVIASMNGWQNSAHIDANLTDNTKVYFNWSHQQDGTEQPNGIWVGSGDWTVPLAAGELSNNNTDLYTVNAVHIFTPTLTVQGRVGFTHLDMPGSPKVAKLTTRAGLNFPQKGVFGSKALPRITNGWSRDNSDIPNLGDYQISYNPNFDTLKETPSAAGDVTKVLKTHTLKAGYSWEHVGQHQDATGTDFGGAYSYPAWAGSATGNLYTDIVMGIVDGHSWGGGYSETAFPKTYWNYLATSQFYVQDDWKVNKRITANIGMRFAHFGAATPDNAFGTAVFNPKTYASDVAANSTHPGLSWWGLNKSIAKGGFTPSLLHYAPRFGAAIDVYGNGKTVVRGGWGVYAYNASIFANGTGTAYGTIQWKCNPDNGCNNWEDVDSHTNNGNGSANPCAAGSNCAPTIPTGGVVQSNPTGYVNTSVNAVDATNKDNPQVTDYSLNVDQKLPGKMLLELSYAGNHLDHGQNSVNLDSVPLGAMSDPAKVLAATRCAKFVGSSAVKDSNGNITTPATTIGDWTNAIGDGTCQQDFRPYSSYQGINVYESSYGTQYDALQVSLTRSTGWAYLNLNYAFSKLHSNTKQSGAFKDYGKKEYWSVDGSNRGSVLNATYNFDLPKVHFGNQILRGVANGWEFAGFTTIQQGFNLTPGFNGLGGGPSLVGTPDVTIYPTFTCNPKSGLVAHQFANGSCYTVTAGSIGNAARAPYIPSPAYWQTDATIVKSVQITEKQKVEFRAQGFNFLNHNLQSFTGGDQNLTVNGNLTKQANCPGSNCQEFGFADYHFGHRVLEFAAKYSF